MRRWVVIGLVVLVIGGIAAFVFRPWESQLQYHKRKYLAAKEHIGQRASLWERTMDRLSDATGLNLRPDGERHWKALDRHREELIRLGFLEQREFAFTHVPVTSAVMRVNLMMANVITTNMILNERCRFNFMNVIDTPSNVVILTAPREDILFWENLLRKADAPEKSE